jgi:hypothetical protein
MMGLNIDKTITDLIEYKQKRKSKFRSNPILDNHKDNQVDTCITALQQLACSLKECKGDSKLEADMYLKFLPELDSQIKKELSFGTLNNGKGKLVQKFLAIEKAILDGLLEKRQFNHYEKAYAIADDRGFSKEAAEHGHRDDPARDFMDKLPRDQRKMLTARALCDIKNSLQLRTADVKGESKGEANKLPSTLIDSSAAYCYAHISSQISASKNRFERPRDRGNFNDFLSSVHKISQKYPNDADGTELADLLARVYRINAHDGYHPTLFRNKPPYASPQQNGYLEDVLDELSEHIIDDPRMDTGAKARAGNIRK